MATTARKILARLHKAERGEARHLQSVAAALGWATRQEWPFSALGRGWAAIVAFRLMLVTLGARRLRRRYTDAIFADAERHRSGRADAYRAAKRRPY
jgi:hypothetical protein